jgi:hypothetical protein
VENPWKLLERKLKIWCEKGTWPPVKREKEKTEGEHKEKYQTETGERSR